MAPKAKGDTYYFSKVYYESGSVLKNPSERMLFFTKITMDAIGPAMSLLMANKDIKKNKQYKIWLGMGIEESNGGKK